MKLFVFYDFFCKFSPCFPAIFFLFYFGQTDFLIKKRPAKNAERFFVLFLYF